MEEADYLNNDDGSYLDVPNNDALFPLCEVPSAQAPPPERMTSSGRLIEHSSGAYQAIYKYAASKNCQVLQHDGWKRREILTEPGGWSYEIIRQSDGSIDIFMLSSPECKVYQGQTCAPGMEKPKVAEKPVASTPASRISPLAKPSQEIQLPVSQKKVAAAKMSDGNFPWTWVIGGLAGTAAVLWYFRRK